MPGHNHYSDCFCGWCLKRKGPLRPKPKIKPVSRIRFEQITIPNATCPVCSARVYYYRNEFGSSVFFDELGPPWHKHPCTDNSKEMRPGPPAKQEFIATFPQWRSAGWIALEYLKSERLDDWIVICFNVIETGEYRRVLSSTYLDCKIGSLVYMHEWDDEFCSDLEIIDRYFSPLRTLCWKYDKWFNVDMLKAINARISKRR